MQGGRGVKEGEAGDEEGLDDGGAGGWEEGVAVISLVASGGGRGSGLR